MRAALDAGTGVVALESTLVAHGLPWPDNLEVANVLEQEVRSQGATPATIAVLDGLPCIGLAAAELERVARAGPAIAKAGSADKAKRYTAKVISLTKGADSQRPEVMALRTTKTASTAPAR